MEKEILSQNQIDTLLGMIEGAKDGENDSVKKEKTRMVKLCDFRRSDILGKQSLRKLSTILEEFCKRITQFLRTEYDMSVSVHLASTDQMTREEFVMCIPTQTFAAHSSWLNGLVLFNMNPSTFLGGILKRPSPKESTKQISTEEMLEKIKKMKEENSKGGKQKKKKPNTSYVLEEKIFMQFFARHFLCTLHETFNQFCEEELPAITEPKFESNTTFLPYTEQRTEMGVMATLEMHFDGESKDTFYPIDFFLNESLIENLCEKKILYVEQKLKIIPLEKPLGNIVAELGRCHVDKDFVFEKNTVLVLDTLAGEAQKIFVNGKHLFFGEALYLDDSRAERMCDDVGLGEFKENSTDENFFNVRVVLGSASMNEADIKGLGEGSIIELNERWNDAVLVYKDGKLAAKGSVYIVNENFAVKIRHIV